MEQETSMVQWDLPAIRPTPTKYPHQPQITYQNEAPFFF